MARHANVSIGPVDRVLHNRGGVSQETRERILKAIEELNYQPNLLASRLKSTKEYVVAVLLPQATKEIPFWHDHILGVEQAEKEIRQLEVTTKVFYFDQNSEDSFRERVNEIMADTVDGVFMVPVFYEEAIRLLRHCQKSQVPCLLFDTNLPDETGVRYIGQNAYDSGYLAAELLSYCIPSDGTILLANIVQEHDNHLQFAKREEGFLAFFRETSLTTELIRFESRRGFSQEIAQQLAEVIRQTPNLNGIFTINGVQHVAQVLEQQGFTDYRLIGYDVIPETIHFLGNGTIHFLISQQPKMQAYEGIKLLSQSILLKKDLPESYYLPIDIVMKSNLKYHVK
ncbi:LacI family DNA-binding transcriptional regulator [Siphonobacter curvatus]|uniref:LacI family DNA-binding transcriptional regulator n=1 Tax=Siphonobacter curvatus TaxID=2094562 RepID=UPI0021CFB486|nr:LacI family DNA-binding transcriptional regulator [Siphonobacter curvatus]